MTTLTNILLTGGMCLAMRDATMEDPLSHTVSPSPLPASLTSWREMFT